MIYVIVRKKDGELQDIFPCSTLVTANKLASVMKYYCPYYIVDVVDKRITRIETE